MRTFGGNVRLPDAALVRLWCSILTSFVEPDWGRMRAWLHGIVGMDGMDGNGRGDARAHLLIVEKQEWTNVTKIAGVSHRCWYFRARRFDLAGGGGPCWRHGWRHSLRHPPCPSGHTRACRLEAKG